MKNISQRLLIVVLVATSGFCFWNALPGRESRFDTEVHASPVNSSIVDANETRLVSRDTRTPAREMRTTPIRDLRVGMRVVGRNPLEDDADRDLPQPSPDSWRLVRAQIEMEAAKFCDVELLRPLEWINANEAQARATIWLELPEMFVEGDANILSIDACPPIEPGTNPIITGTFSHLAKRVVDVHVAGSSNPIGCTPEHPFWSERRGDFVPVSRLEVGEEVLTAYGNSVRISCIVPRAGPETVYGIEVYGEHVYHVSLSGLLVHNASGEAGNYRRLRAAKRAGRGQFDASDEINHLNQDAIYGRMDAPQGGRRIPHGRGASTPLAGQATDPRTEHGRFHRSLENYFNTFREGGARAGTLPTNAEYSTALYQALKSAGKSPKEAYRLMDSARRQRLSHGHDDGHFVPRIPGEWLP